MGEYVEINGQQHKLGTCETLYYVRRREVEESHALGLARELKGYISPVFFYRFPWPDEDGQKISASDGRDYDKTFEFNCSLPDSSHKERCVYVHPEGKNSGYNINVLIPCPSADNKDFDLDSSQRHARYRIKSEKYTEDGKPMTVIGCAYCDQWFRIDEKEAETIRAAILAYDNDPDNPDSWHKQVAARVHAVPEPVTA